jgi:hypothetical protein
MSAVNRKKKKLTLFWMRWLLTRLDRDELEYQLGRMLFIFGYWVCVGLLILMAIPK